MEVQMFNFAYFFWVAIAVGSYIGLYYLLKRFSIKTQKIVIFSLLAFALVLHFLKVLIPPFSTDKERWLTESWPINICTANIFLYPFLYLSKSKIAKDYMFYLGILSSIIAILYPVEALEKANQYAEYLDVIRFYVHHIIIGVAPTLMVMLGHHKLDYKRVWSAPVILLVVMLFIMVCQVLQSELGYVDIRDKDFFDPNYKNSSFIWGPGDNSLAKVFTAVCPKFFKTVPIGEYVGQEKYWPWFWMIFPVFIYITPLSFGLCMFFENKNFCTDVKRLFTVIKNKTNKTNDSTKTNPTDAKNSTTDNIKTE
ncbi:MAG: YwaF family protein [Clostridia bacterium]|nr:YwaF family protein [Clostridia bacterium]